MQEAVLLQMRHIDKQFPGVKALSNVDFTLRKGEIHALMGENGAGKSTLIKILTGVYQLDGGEITVDGENVIIRSPQDAQNHGISTVYQEITLCPNLTVAENMFIGREGGAWVRHKAFEKRADEILTKLGIPARSTQQLGDCSLAVQQMVAIARAVDMKCKVLILDEPTSSLDDKEVKMLFDLMKDLKSQGVGIIFVTHFLEQVYEVSDRITVLRNGELVGEYPVQDLPQVQLVSKMIGKDLDELNALGESGEKKNENTEVLYEAEGLSSNEAKPFDFSIRKGEVNGFTGLLGSGRSECVRAIFGADKVNGGTVKIKGRQVRITRPIHAIKNGIGYLAEDRKRDGIIAELSVRENIILAMQVMNGIFKPISRSETEAFADEYIKVLNIKTASRETPVGSLSGGNQQKVILGRWMEMDPRVLIMDEPTRGIDVGAKYEIYCIIADLAKEGKSIIMISSEMSELIGMSDRIMVMCDGRVTGFVDGQNATQESIMAYATQFE